MDRQRIDWENLQPLTRKRADRGATRDDLAARKFNMGKAKHKGRCHISNQKRRQIAAQKAADRKIVTDTKTAKGRSLKDRVRAYWAGETDEHP